MRFLFGFLLATHLSVASATCDHLLIDPRYLGDYKLHEDGHGATYADGTAVRRLVESYGEIKINGDVNQFKTVGIELKYARTGRSRWELIQLGATELQDLQGKRVLDAGTGNGELVFELRRYGIDAYGSDIFLDHSQLQTGFLVPADSASLPFLDSSFDVVISSHSTFYSSYDSHKHLAQLCEFYRVLRPGGTLIIVGGVVERVFDRALPLASLNWVLRKNDRTYVLKKR